MYFIWVFTLHRVHGAINTRNFEKRFFVSFRIYFKNTYSYVMYQLRSRRAKSASALVFLYTGVTFSNCIYLFLCIQCKEIFISLTFAIHVKLPSHRFLFCLWNNLLFKLFHVCWFWILKLISVKSGKVLMYGLITDLIFYFLSDTIRLQQSCSHIFVNLMPTLLVFM